ncbi:MAG: hypothetical protein IJ466_09380 [Clostridia bacterium]|nr:hypothetical protein [Clostridia bacterium]
MFDSFRGFDLRPRQERIRRAMNLIPPRSADDIPVIAHTPCYFGFGCKRMPEAYWQDPAVMLAFQQDGYEQHLKTVNDDVVPYFMPWFGTGVLASAFGCPMREAGGNGDDPAVLGVAISEPEDVAKLKKPDPFRDGWMPRVIRFMEYAARHGEMPVGPTDLNSPLCTAAQLVGYDKLFYWMYDEENAVDDLMSLITETFIDWVRLQKEITGEAIDMSNGLQGVWTPRGGVWLSDDDLVSVGPELYERFVLPHYQRIFAEFGGGHLHYCGVGTHQIENILKIPQLTAVNNSAMGNAEAFTRLAQALSGKLAIEIQDVAPVTPDSYYEKIFANIHDFTGIMVATFVEDDLGMDDAGRTIAVSRPAVENANQVVRAVRAAAAKCMQK